MIKHILPTDRVLTDKERKNLAILEAIRKSGPISRTDISKMTEFNIVTVSNYVNHYIKKGLVVEGRLDESTGGRKPVLVELNPKAAYIVGVGLNMLSVVGVVVDLETNIVYELKKERRPENTEGTIQDVQQMLERLVKESKIDKAKIAGIGVGVPGVIDERGRTIRWPQLLGEKDASICVSIRDTFEQRLGISTFVENDANAAVLGEKWLGLERDVRDMLYMFSGIGCGILINGEIYRGATGAAGELGIYSAKPEHQHFVRSSTTQLGRWVMDVGMADRARAYLKEQEQSLLADLVKGKVEAVTIKEIIEAAKQKDRLALRVIEEAGIDFGRKVAFLVNLFNPEIVVIGGGIEECGAPLLNVLKTTVKEWANEEVASQVKIIPSAFGDKAVAFGVVGIVARELFAQA